MENSYCWLPSVDEITYECNHLYHQCISSFSYYKLASQIRRPLTSSPLPPQHSHTITISMATFENLPFWLFTSKVIFSLISIDLRVPMSLSTSLFTLLSNLALSLQSPILCFLNTFAPVLPKNAAMMFRSSSVSAQKTNNSKKLKKSFYGLKPLAINLK